MALLFFFLVSVCILLAVSGGYVFFLGCLRRKDLEWLDPVALQKTPYGRFSEHIAAAKLWLDAHNAQEVSVLSYDGLTLKGLWVPADHAKGTMLLVHGYRSCVLVDFGLVLNYYHSMGMNLLLPDQRCHGKSEGKYITFGVKESRDIQSWLDLHNARFGKLPTILSGLSMGASTVLYLADASLPDNVRGIIADCGFTSPKDIISTVYKSVTHLPAMLSVWVADIFARVFAGFSLSEKDTRLALKNSRLPVIMVHGTADTFVPCQMTIDAYTCCSGDKQLLLVEGADHGVSFLHARDRYEKLVIDFLKKYVF